MSQTLANVLPLVDKTIIKNAQDNVDAKVTQSTAAQQQVTTTAQAYTAAQVALAAAVQSGGSVSPLDAAHAVEDADRARRVAAMVGDAAAQAVTDAKEVLRLAVSRAWRPVYLAGARQRLAAARAGDAAKLALAAAERDHAEGTHILDAATREGAVGVSSILESSFTHCLASEADELNLWTSNGFDPVAGTYPKHWN